MNPRIEQSRQELMKRLAPALDWYQSRDSREQRILQALAVLLIAALIFWLIWLPSWHAREEARHRYQVNQQTLSWIQDNVPAVQAAQGQSKSASQATLGKDWIGGISSSAQHYGLMLRGFTPNGSDSVRIQLENQPASPMLLWLHSLEEQGIKLTTLEMSAGEDSGTANLHATLSR